MSWGLLFIIAAVVGLSFAGGEHRWPDYRGLQYNSAGPLLLRGGPPAVGRHSGNLGTAGLSLIVLLVIIVLVLVIAGAVH